MNESRNKRFRFTALPETGAHEIVCESRGALAAVYDQLSELAGVETCTVDLPNLRLVVRMADRALRRVSVDPTRHWIDRVQRIASGR